MDNKLIRKTRGMQYHQLPDGSIEAEPRIVNVTWHSFVISQAIEYKKPRKVKKSPVKVIPIPDAPRCRAKRATINERANRAVKVYAPINLDASSVPKPFKLKNGKQKSKLELRDPSNQSNFSFAARVYHFYLILLFFSPFFSVRETISYNGQH